MFTTAMLWAPRISLRVRLFIPFLEKSYEENICEARRVQGCETCKQQYMVTNKDWQKHDMHASAS